MRLNFTLFFLLLLSITAYTQKLTGIWRGHFSSSSGIYKEGIREEMYKYEIQIEQQANNGLKGITYSYKSTVFYGKAELQGILSLPDKSLIIRETKLVDLKIGDKSEPCLMTCYLDYSKIGKLEILEGTFISLNAKDKADCGSGKVYLERVNSSDFKKEDFLIKKKQTDTLAKKKTADSLRNVSQPTKTPNAKETIFQDKTVKKPVSPPTTTKELPKKSGEVAKKNEKKSATSKPIKKEEKVNPPSSSVERIPESAVNSKKNETSLETQDEIIKKVPIPRVLKERENSLVRTIQTTEEFIQIDLYDNGTIDNDTISVYHNNEIVVSNNRLSYSPITIKIKSTKINNRHELIVVAENLGDIPPNTALMVIKAGKERYEIFLASNEQRNAKVVVEYTPKE